MENTSTTRAVSAIQALLDEMDSIILSGDYPATLPQVRTRVIQAAAALSTEFSQRLQNVGILAATTTSLKTTTPQKVVFPVGNPPKRSTSGSLPKKTIAVVVADKQQPQIQASVQPAQPKASQRKLESLYDITQQFVPIAKYIIRNSASDSGKTYGSNLVSIAANLGVDITTQKTDTAKAAAIKTFLNSFPNAEKWAANEEFDDSDDSQNENADNLQVEPSEQAEISAEIPTVDELDTEELLIVAGKDITTGAPTEEVASEAIQAVKKTKKKIK